MTERQPGRDDGQNRETPRAKPEPARPQPVPERSSATPDEEALFDTGPGPRIFGEGSYADGGSNQEGNFKERQARPHGSRGSFDDAGGYGGTELLGGRPADEAARRNRHANEEEKTGADDSIEDV